MKLQEPQGQCSRRSDYRSNRSFSYGLQDLETSNIHSFSSDFWIKYESSSRENSFMSSSSVRITMSNILNFGSGYWDEVIKSMSTKF
jgi:hypothetical protein